MISKEQVEQSGRKFNGSEDLKHYAYQLMKEHFPKGVYHPLFRIKKNLIFHRLLDLRVAYWLCVLEQQKSGKDVLVHPYNLIELKPIRANCVDSWFVYKGVDYDQFWNVEVGVL